MIPFFFLLLGDIYFQEIFNRYLIMFWSIFQTRLWNHRLIHSVFI